MSRLIALQIDWRWVEKIVFIILWILTPAKSK